MKLIVHRQTSDGDRTVQTHEVPEFEGMTVLDALLWVRTNIDPTLAVRFSCRCANACKQCLALVDGKRTYTCVVPAIDTVTVEPLPNKEPVRDIVVHL